MPIQLNNLRTIRAQLKLRAIQRQNNQAIIAACQSLSSANHAPRQFKLLDAVHVATEDLCFSSANRRVSKRPAAVPAMTADLVVSERVSQSDQGGTLAGANNPFRISLAS